LGRSGKRFHAHRDVYRHRDYDRHAYLDVHPFADRNIYRLARTKPYGKPTNATSHQDARGGRNPSIRRPGYADPDADLLAAYIYINADADKYPQAEPGAASTSTHGTTAPPHRTTATTHRNALPTHNAHTHALKHGASLRRIKNETGGNTMSKSTIDEQVAILMRGAEFGDDQIYEHMRAELRERLIEAKETGRPLRVYAGFDPTATYLTIGHTVPMRKLRQFQELGHQVTFLIGSFTGLIGDPSDTATARAQQTPEQVAENARTYTEQAFKILDPEKTIVRENAEWLSKLTFRDVIKLASHFTVQQFLARDNFAQRYGDGGAIWLHEFFYALMQGYDAVAQETDVQVGGTDQLFNLLAGRKLQEAFGQRPQVCITLPILVGTDGHVRMGKSKGNYVGLTESPEDKYGKTMSIPDSAMRNWFELVTRWTPEQINELLGAVERHEVHPMEAKKRLAWEIVSIFDGDETADRAAAHFERVHQKRKLPKDMPSRVLTSPINLVDIIYDAGFAPSKSQARRLVQQGAVKLDGERLTDIEADIAVEEEKILQVGKRRFLKLVSE